MSNAADNQRSGFSSYNRKMTVVILAILFASVAVNIFIDPLRVNEYWVKEGVNGDKPKIHRYARIAKPLQIENKQPDVLVLGSSRTEFGIRPALINEVTGSDNAFNAAVSAGTYHDIEKFYFHAVATTDVKEVIIGVDFFAFNALNGKPYQFPQILAATSGEDSNLFHRLNQWLLTYLSFDMLRASFSTMRDQDEGAGRINDSGWRNNRVRIDKFIQRQGMYQTFVKTEFTYARASWTHCSNASYRYENPATGFNTIEALRHILDNARENNVKVKLFMAPAHARLWITLDEIGLWDYYEQWRRDMALLVVDYPNVVLWDFSNFNDYTSEKLPEDGDREYEMAWHIDASHYRAELGDMALKTMYDTPDKPEGFGIRLTPANVEEQIRALREGKESFKAQRPEEYAEILKNVDYAVGLREKYGNSCPPSVVTPGVPDR